MNIRLAKLFFFFKKKLPFIWMFVEFVNGVIFKLIYYKIIINNTFDILNKVDVDKYSYRLLEYGDLKKLSVFFEEQNQDHFLFFKPHGFDIKTLKRLLKNPSFFQFAVFDDNKIIGYFFLRCFINKQCFNGHIVDERYQGQGIARIMDKIVLNIAWSSKFRVFGNASNENIKSIKSFEAICDYHVIKKLDNNYFYFEYLKSEKKDINL